MNEAWDRRLAAWTGLAIAAAVAFWWLGGTRLALDHRSDASRPAVGALHGLWLVRGMALAMLCVRVSALRGWRPGSALAVALIVPSWPMVVLAWSASTTAWPLVALAELVLLAGGMALPLIGLGVRRMLSQPQLAEAAGTTLGAALTATLWFMRGQWSLLPP